MPGLKRILLIIALLLVAIAIGLGLYTMFKKTSLTTAPAEQKETGTPGTLPGAGERQAPTAGAPTTQELERGETVVTGQIPQSIPGSYYQPTPITQASADMASYTSVNQTGAVRYFNSADGKFYKINPDGSIKMMSDETFYNVQNATWAKTQDKAVLEYPDGNKIVYNFDTKKQATLPNHWQDFSFSADGSQIAAKSIGLATENRWLITTNDDGTGTRLVEPMGENADLVTVDWSPSKQTVAFSLTGEAVGADRQEVLFVGTNHENFKSAIVEGRGFEPQWSPTGQKLLYSVYSARSEYKPELWVSGAYGDDIGTNRQMLKINTWAKKCAFADESTLYCAVPRELPMGAGMSPEIAHGTKDDLYKIDLKTGLKNIVSTGGQDYEFENINYDKTSNKLFFTNYGQQGIYQVNL